MSLVKRAALQAEYTEPVRQAGTLLSQACKVHRVVFEPSSRRKPHLPHDGLIRSRATQGSVANFVAVRRDGLRVRGEADYVGLQGASL